MNIKVGYRACVCAESFINYAMSLDKASPCDLHSLRTSPSSGYPLELLPCLSEKFFLSSTHISHSSLPYPRQLIHNYRSFVRHKKTSRKDIKQKLKSGGTWIINAIFIGIERFDCSSEGEHSGRGRIVTQWWLIHKLSSAQSRATLGEDEEFPHFRQWERKDEESIFFMLHNARSSAINASELRWQ